MSEPQWLPYFGAVTGGLGALTGLAGAWMGWIAYRRSNQIKSLDLRLELRKAINELEQTFTEANELIPYAKQSRERVFAARGLRDSGAMQIWQEHFEKDRAAVPDLAARIPKTVGLEDLKLQQLEMKLSDVHKLQLEVTAIVERLEAGITEDDQYRTEIRQSWSDVFRRGKT